MKNKYLKSTLFYMVRAALEFRWTTKNVASIFNCSKEQARMFQDEIFTPEQAEEIFIARHALLSSCDTQ